MLKHILINIVWIASLGLAHAGEPSTTGNSKFKQECSTCHIAYAPALLPAKSWQKIMSELKQHFGNDASLDSRDTEEITRYLVEQANNRSMLRITDTSWYTLEPITNPQASHSPPARISKASWFEREHTDISPETWRSNKIKSPANCNACHPKAAQADFFEYEVKVPTH